MNKIDTIKFAADRGSADAYYHRGSSPHYYSNGSLAFGTKIEKDHMTPSEIAAYENAYKNEHDRKDWVV